MQLTASSTASIGEIADRCGHLGAGISVNAGIDVHAGMLSKANEVNLFTKQWPLLDKCFGAANAMTNRNLAVHDHVVQLIGVAEQSSGLVDRYLGRSAGIWGVGVKYKVEEKGEVLCGREVRAQPVKARKRKYSGARVLGIHWQRAHSGALKSLTVSKMRSLPRDASKHYRLEQRGPREYGRRKLRGSFSNEPRSSGWRELEPGSVPFLTEKTPSYFSLKPTYRLFCQVPSGKALKQERPYHCLPSFAQWSTFSQF
ncbi:hypothetical protein C8R44DRAFT_742728 [Mycena epipterygia]|nr:hypothetical protein C8R44DRAFT_742728 [Mycena epipterygia]